MAASGETDIGTEVPERTNLCAIVGLFCALTGLFVPALAFGATRYVDTVGPRARNRSGLAVAAMILGTTELMAVVMAIVLAAPLRFRRVRPARWALA